MFNGNIHIVNVDTSSIEGTFRGSDSRVLALTWHPIFESVFATGSFDNNVRVHDIKKNSILIFKEHKDRVRSLVWNCELPWMLITAADDS